ncbi:MAG: hypothetical protein KatS3mg129_1333 [Leptospiraceae bacterium]|nr:MAG: hypothetical protein KatS3mg129_1333 [Leptospiraceae bacterium]
MENPLELYKELYKDMIDVHKKDEYDKVISELESYQEEIPEKLLTKIESFTKPYPVPLYYFSFLRIIQIALSLKKKLFLNYNYYFNLYNKLRKKDERIEEENRLLNEVGEILYRMDEIDGNLKRIIPQLLEVIHKQIQKDNKEESIFLKKINKESYEEIYPIYEELIHNIHNLIDELKLEKGLFKLSKLLVEESHINTAE